MCNTTKLTARDFSYLDADTRPAFVVRDTASGAIQGVGDTEFDAVMDAMENLASAGITVADAEPMDHTQVTAASLVVLEVLPEMAD